MGLIREYKSKSFQTRIELSLADISSSPNDEFKLVKTSYELFDCELCGHKYCMYQFVIENLKTKKRIKVGSECIHHFKGKGVDIDLAMGLLKRIQKTVMRARKDMRLDIDKDDYEKLSLEDKRQLTIKYFVREQAKQLLRNVARNKTILTKEQINEILDLGLERELNKAKARQEEMRSFIKAKEIESEFENLIKVSLETNKEISSDMMESYASKWDKFYPHSSYGLNQIRQDYDGYMRRKKAIEKFNWLLKYTGSNGAVLDIRKKLLRYGSISDKQEEYAKNLIKREKIPNVLAYLVINKPTEFVKSVSKQYADKGYVSSKQSKILYNIYNSIRRKK